MIITKNIQTKVCIRDPNLLYSGDIDAVILDDVKQRFEGNCYMSCLILNIVKILKRSNFVFSKQRQDGSATCSVCLLVRGIVINKYEILHGCNVKKIDKDGHIICKSEHAAVYIRASNILQSIKQGQIIVALAGDIKYNTFKSSISINALPFIPRRDPSRSTVYRLTVSAKTKILENLLQTLNDKIKDVKSIEKPIYNFFVDLFYPYKSRKTSDNKYESMELIETILNYDENSIILISQPDWILMYDTKVVIHEKIETIDVLNDKNIQGLNEGILVEENYEPIVGAMIHNFIEYYINIENLCKVYNTMEKIEKNKNLWDIYTKNRY